MSFDIQLAHPCPHRTEQQVVTLSNNLEISVKQPIANPNTCVVYANDQIIPKEGLYSSAVIKSRISGPFYIPKYENKLIISTTLDHIEIDLPLSSFNQRLTTDELVFLIKKQAKNFLVLNEDGFLVFVEKSTVGSNSVIQILGEAKNHIGFDYQNSIRGKMIYPGWSLVPFVIGDGTIREEDIRLYTIIRFNSPIKSNPLMRVSYNTFRERCLRCVGTGVENDFRFSSEGVTLTVANENLLYQSAIKVLLTDAGSNPFFKSYGTNLRRRIGMKAVGAVTQVISTDVRQALSIFQRYQSEQAKYQVMNLKERLYSVVSVEAIQNDPTTYIVDVVVQNASAEQVSISIVYTTSGTVGRLVKNGVSLSQLGSF